RLAEREQRSQLISCCVPHRLPLLCIALTIDTKSERLGVLPQHAHLLCEVGQRVEIHGFNPLHAVHCLRNCCGLRSIRLTVLESSHEWAEQWCWLDGIAPG